MQPPTAEKRTFLVHKFHNGALLSVNLTIPEGAHAFSASPCHRAVMRLQAIVTIVGISST
jgi:hypothetical protein